MPLYINYARNVCVQRFCTAFMYNVYVQRLCTTFMYNVSVPVVPENFVSAEPYLLASDYLVSTRSNDDSKLEMKNEYIIQLNFKR